MLAQLLELGFDAAFAVYWVSKKTCKSVYYYIYPDENPVLPKEYSLTPDQLQLIMKKLENIEAENKQILSQLQ
jgi:hypothetical protein